MKVYIWNKYSVDIILIDKDLEKAIEKANKELNKRGHCFYIDETDSVSINSLDDFTWIRENY